MNRRKFIFFRNLLAISLCTMLLASCETRRMAKEVIIEDYFVRNEFIAQMYDLEQGPEMEKKFRRQKLKITDEIAPWLKIVRLEFDTTCVEPELMYAKLLRSGYCRELEFNKNLQPRN